MYVAIFLIVVLVILFAVINYISSVAKHEALLIALRRENAQLMHDKLSLERKNMELRDEKRTLEQQLERARTKLSIRETYNSDVISALQAELRRKDKLINQKWAAAKAVYAAEKV
jgi:hypothetical protein